MDVLTLDKRYKLKQLYGIKKAIFYRPRVKNHPQFYDKLKDMFGSENEQNARYKIFYPKARNHLEFNQVMVGFYDERDITMMMLSV